ncbi:MAG: hypothetical protein U9N40_02180 [Euryarchaeota archaeon]|nr:hypothetical protein [Euryarchaeota archaeon]
MVKQSNMVSLFCKIIFILLMLSSFLTLIVYFTSSEAIEIWQIPETNPYVLLNASPQSNEIICSTLNQKEIKQSFKGLDEILVDKNFIGIIKDGNYTIALIDRGDEILEVVSGCGNTWQYLLTPECLGKTHFEKMSPEIRDAEAGMALYRIELTLPDEGSNQKKKYVDIYDVWCENGWSFWGSKNLLHTEGRFYVNYGQAVLHVIDKSYLVTSTGFYQYQNCRSEIGHGNTAGWITNNNIWSLYNFPTNTKFSTDSWITVDMYYNTQLGISSDKWISISLPQNMNRSSTSGILGSPGDTP